MKRRYKPLASNKTYDLFYHMGGFYKYANDNYTKIAQFKRSVFDCFRITERIFRRIPRVGVHLYDELFLIAWKKQLILLDGKSGESRTIFVARPGFSNVLNITVTNKDSYIALWGDYGGNPQYEPINIYGLRKDLTYEILYTFRAGTVRHIHSIVNAASGIYILVGDNENLAGIHKFDFESREMVPIAVGEYMYRSVAAFDTKQGLLYASDSVENRNGIYLLENGKTEKICELQGSCIYGIKLSEGYLFSTTVEGTEEGNGLYSLVSRKKGKGILSDYVEIIYVDKDYKAYLVKRFIKDFLPYKLFQYGCVEFSYSYDGGVWMFPVAVKSHEAIAIKVYESELKDESPRVLLKGGTTQ